MNEEQKVRVSVQGDPEQSVQLSERLQNLFDKQNEAIENGPDIEGCLDSDSENRVEEMTQDFKKKFEVHHEIEMPTIYQQLFSLENGIIPDRWEINNVDKHWNGDMNMLIDAINDETFLFQFKEFYNMRCGFVLPNLVWLENFTSFLKHDSGKDRISILEICSGLGMLARCIETYSKGEISVTCIDLCDYGIYDKSQFEKPFHPIIQMDGLEAIKGVNTLFKGIDYVMLCWPPYLEEIDYKVLSYMKENLPEMKLIYIGEYNECTGSPKFFELLEEEYDEVLYDHYDINGGYQQFPHIRDFTSLWEKRK